MVGDERFEVSNPMFGRPRSWGPRMAVPVAVAWFFAFGWLVFGLIAYALSESFSRDSTPYWLFGPMVVFTACYFGAAIIRDALAAIEIQAMAEFSGCTGDEEEFALCENEDESSPMIGIDPNGKRDCVGHLKDGEFVPSVILGDDPYGNKETLNKIVNDLGVTLSAPGSPECVNLYKYVSSRSLSKILSLPDECRSDEVDVHIDMIRIAADRLLGSNEEARK